MVWKFWSAWYKIFSWLTPWPYMVLPRKEPYSQLPSLLVHWSYQERNTQAILHKCGGVCRLMHGESGLQIITLTKIKKFRWKSWFLSFITLLPHPPIFSSFLHESQKCIFWQIKFQKTRIPEKNRKVTCLYSISQ